MLVHCTCNPQDHVRLIAHNRGVRSTSVLLQQQLPSTHAIRTTVMTAVAIAMAENCDMTTDSRESDSMRCGMLLLPSSAAWMMLSNDLAEMMARTARLVLCTKLATIVMMFLIAPVHHHCTAQGTHPHQTYPIVAETRPTSAATHARQCIIVQAGAQSSLHSLHVAKQRHGHACRQLTRTSTTPLPMNVTAMNPEMRAAYTSDQQLSSHAAAL